MYLLNSPPYMYLLGVKISLGFMRRFFGLGELFIKSITAGSFSVSTQFLLPLRTRGINNDAVLGVDNCGGSVGVGEGCTSGVDRGWA